MKIFQHKAYKNEKNKVVTLLIKNKWFVSTIDKEDNVIAKKPHHYSLNLTILEKLMGKTTEEKLKRLIKKVSISCDELNKIDNKSDVEFIELIDNKRAEKVEVPIEITEEQIPPEPTINELISRSEKQEHISVIDLPEPEPEPEPTKDAIEYMNIEDTYEPKEKSVKESDYTELDDSEFIKSEKPSPPDSHIESEKVIPAFEEEISEPEDKLQKILNENSDEAKIPCKHELTEIIQEVTKRKPGRPKKKVDE